MKQHVASHKVPMGFVYETEHHPKSFDQLASHARLSPEEARRALRDLVDSIPAEHLHNFMGGQVTVIA